MYHGKEDIILLDTPNKLLACAAYDACRKVGGYFTIELKMRGDTALVYLVPTYSWDDLQEGPRVGFRDDINRLKGIVTGVVAGWTARP